MIQDSGFFTRIGRWMGIGRGTEDRLPLEEHATENSTALAPSASASSQPTLSFLRPWARRDAAIAGLQQGFGSLADLMSTIRDNLEKQGRRQDEMLSYLSHLPEILQSLPEAQRIHGETLRAIGQQLQQQIGQQTRLTEILAKVSETSTGQKEVLESLNAQVQTAGGHNQAISENLRQVSTAMEGLGQNSKSSSEVLQHLRDGQAQRDDQLQRIIERQGARFTVLLIVASAVSLAAVATAVVAVVLTLKGRG